MMSAERLETTTVGIHASTHKVHSDVSVHLGCIPRKLGSAYAWVSCHQTGYTVYICFGICLIPFYISQSKCVIVQCVG